MVSRTDQDRLATAAAAGAPVEQGTSCTVLLVEHDRAQRDLVARGLRGAGYRVIEARDGDEAFQALEGLPRFCDAPLGVVLLDMALPKESGMEVLQQLTAHCGGAPLIAISSNTRHLSAALAAGAHAILVRPFELDHLLAEVERWCLRRRSA